MSRRRGDTIVDKYDTCIREQKTDRISLYIYRLLKGHTDVLPISVPLLFYLEKARQPLYFLLHVHEGPRLQHHICVYPQRLRQPRASVRFGSPSEVLRERPLLLLEFVETLVVSGTNEAIIL